MPPMYSPAARALQDRFATRRLADRLAEVKVHDRFTPEDGAFLERLDMFFLARPAPIPEWKHSEWAGDVQPADDPARTGRDDPGEAR